MNPGWYKAPKGWKFHYFNNNGFSLCQNYKFSPRFMRGTYSLDHCCKSCANRHFKNKEKIK